MLTLVAAFFLVMWMLQRRAGRARAAELAAVAAELAAVAGELETARKRIAELEPYASIADIEKHGEEIRSSARLAAEKILEDARTQASLINEELSTARRDVVRIQEDAVRHAAEEIEKAKNSASQILHTATLERDTLAARAALLTEEIEQRLSSAREQAGQIIATAHADAERLLDESRRSASESLQSTSDERDRIAAEIQDLKNRISDLQQTLAALRNITDGYGDEYVIPTFTLLDNLAEEFGYEEAGRKHKEIRAQVRRLTQERRGAECDYVEANRRETAITFVVDAFNGKVDSIMSDVKTDNFGTLAQKVRDARSLVNKNGTAFRNAKITQEFMDLRIEELRWSCILTALKEREREEQRALRERIREEERAQKEIERALKEAAKEEESLAKAMERVRADLEKAADADRQRYEAKLSELQEKLREAEEKSKRALSMAQLTKSGHVYIISNVGSFGDDVFKIGLTRRLDPLDRVRELGDASVPFEFDVHALIKSENAPALETELHRHFVRKQVNKVNPRKEFFRVTLSEIRTVIENLGHNAHWSMTAAARSYRESLAIEKALQEKRLDEDQWLKKQLEVDAAAFDEDEGIEPASPTSTKKKQAAFA